MLCCGWDSTSESVGERSRRRTLVGPSTSRTPDDQSQQDVVPVDRGSIDGETVASPSRVPSVASATDGGQPDAKEKFFEEVAAPKPPEVVQEEFDEETRKLFLENYWVKVKDFDEDKDEDVRFFRGIRDPDAFTSFSPRGVVLVRNADQTWDALIRKVPNEGHQAATAEFLKQLGIYADAMNSVYTPNIRAGGGHEKVDRLDLVDEVLPEKRTDPDVVLRVALGDDTGPRVVIEVELSNRDPLKLAKHVHQLMTSWQDLRCVIGIKIYKRSERGGPFAVVGRSAATVPSTSSASSTSDLARAT